MAKRQGPHIVDIKSVPAVECIPPANPEPESLLRVVLVSDDHALFTKLQYMAVSEGVQLFWARSLPDDLMALRADVQVVDPRAMGRENWEIYCEHLDDVNNESSYPMLLEDETVISGEELMEDCPLIIIDDDGPAGEGPFAVPRKPKGTLLFIPRSKGIERIVDKVTDLLREKGKRHERRRNG